MNGGCFNYSGWRLALEVICRIYRAAARMPVANSGATATLDVPVPNRRRRKAALRRPISSVCQAPLYLPPQNTGPLGGRVLSGGIGAACVGGSAGGCSEKRGDSNVAVGASATGGKRRVGASGVIAGVCNALPPFALGGAGSVRKTGVRSTLLSVASAEGWPYWPRNGE